MKLQTYKKWEISRDNKFLDLLEYNPNAKILDIGCDNGNFTLKVKAIVNSSDVLGY